MKDDSKANFREYADIIAKAISQLPHGYSRLAISNKKSLVEAMEVLFPAPSNVDFDDAIGSLPQPREIASEYEEEIEVLKKLVRGTPRDIPGFDVEKWLWHFYGIPIRIRGTKAYLIWQSPDTLMPEIIYEYNFTEIWWMLAEHELFHREEEKRLKSGLLGWLR